MDSSPQNENTVIDYLFQTRKTFVHLQNTN